MSDIMGASTPEEKIAKQAQMAKSALDRSMCCGKEFAEMATKAQYDAMEVISNRIGECVDEMRAMARSNGSASTPVVVGKVANKQ
jgi:phasin family protein